MNNIKRLVLAASLLLGGLAVMPQTVSAHHPVLSTTVTRPCGVDQPWSGSFMAQSDADWNKNWRSTYTIGAAAPVGPSAWVDDQVKFGPIAIGPFPATVSSVLISVTSEWKYPNGTGYVTATRTATVYRPASTNCAGGQPVAPIYTPPTCSAPGTLVVTDTNAYTWTLSGGVTARIATAVAKPGFTLTGQTVFGPYNIAQLAAGSETCPNVVPPVFTPPTCSAPGTLVVTDTNAYTWTLSGDDAARIATAVAKPGFTLTGATVFGPYNLLQLTSGSGSCPIPINPAVHVAPTCSSEGTLIGAPNNAYTWVYSGDTSARVATAVPNQGVTLVGQTVYGPFDLRVLAAGSESCPVPVIPPIHVQPTCVAEGTLIGTDTEHYTWSYAGDISARTATANAVANHFITGTTTFGPFNLAKLTQASDECPVSVSVRGICYEVNPGAEKSVWGYWYEVTNGETSALSITWGNGQSANLPGGATLRIADESANASGISVSIGGNVVATTDGPPAEMCQNNVTLTKDVVGPGPGADTRYTIRVSRLVAGEGTATYVEEQTFTMLDNESKTISLPSTLNSEGISYKIQETVNGGASSTSITPSDTFILNGHKNETISAVIVNKFAAVEIVKTVSKVVVFPGDEINYDLVVTNTGAMTLSPVVVDDRLPSALTFVDYSIVGGAAAGSCGLVESTKPQLVTCTLTSPIAPGGTGPKITLLAKVDATITSATDVVNQARVNGTYATDTPPSTGGPGAAITDLTCIPTEGQVCDLSAMVNLTISAPPSTTAAPPTTLVSSEAPATTIVAELPKTGSDSTSMTLRIGLIFLMGGLAIAGVARRRRAI